MWRFAGKSCHRRYCILLTTRRSSRRATRRRIHRVKASSVENSRRKPTEKITPKVSAPLSPSPSPSTPFLFSSNPSPSPQISHKNPSPSPQISHKNPSPSPVENYRRIPTEVSAPLHSKKVELPRYEIPEHLKEEIKKDIVPSVLKMPLHALNYADYFGALLYAEDFYSEKWSEYRLSDVTLRLSRKETKKNNKSQMGKDFVAFEIDSVPERRPYLLSRDYVRNLLDEKLNLSRFV